MFRIFLVVLLLAVLLVVGNTMQISKIKDQTPHNILSEAQQKIPGAFPYLKERQKLYYEGLRIVDISDLYFIATHVMAPHFLLEARLQPLAKGDTVMGIFTAASQPDTISCSRMLWNDRSDTYLYCLYVK